MSNVRMCERCGDIRIQVIGPDASNWNSANYREIDIAHALCNGDDYTHPIKGGFQLDGIMRYYGPGYERGNWPTIFGVLVTLQKMFPQSKVWYGSGHDDDWTIVDDTFYADMWEHYFGPNSHDYHKANRDRLLQSDGT